MSLKKIDFLFMKRGFDQNKFTFFRRNHIFVCKVLSTPTLPIYCRCVWVFPRISKPRALIYYRNVHPRHWSVHRSTTVMCTLYTSLCTDIPRTVTCIIHNGLCTELPHTGLCTDIAS